MNVRRSQANGTAVKENDRYIIVELEDDGGRRIVTSAYNPARAESAIDLLPVGNYEIHHIDTIDMVEG